jgi:hypothetical protein
VKEVIKYVLARCKNNMRGWGGDVDGGFGDGEGTGTKHVLRGEYGYRCPSPCHSLIQILHCDQ